MLEYEKIKESLTIGDIIRIMDFLGAKEYQRNEFKGFLVFKTICHNVEADNGSFKLYYYEENQKFVCYTDCSKSYDIFDLFEKRMNLLGKEFVFSDMMKVILNGKTFRKSDFENENYFKKSLPEYRDQYIQKTLSELNEKLLSGYVKYDNFEWRQEGISDKVIEEFNIKLEQISGDIIIPHYDVDGRLIGIRKRVINKELSDKIGKYLPTKINSIECAHPLGLNCYGLNINKENIKNKKYCIIFEGEKSTLKAQSYGIDNSIAVCGSSISIPQIRLIKKHCNPMEIVIAFDREYPNGGSKKREEYFKKMTLMKNKLDSIIPTSFIFDFCDLTKEKDSPIDQGGDVFKKLLEKRIRSFE